MALSQKVFHFGTDLLKKVPKFYSEHHLFRSIVLRLVTLNLLFGDLSQNEELFEIKPPLGPGAAEEIPLNLGVD